MKYIGFILLAVVAVIIVLLLIAVLRTLLMPSKTSTYVADEPEEEALALAEKLSKMIQYDTTSYANVAEVEKFLGFHKVLEELFPLVHEKLEKTEIDGNLLFYWKGKSSEKPILLMSHQDVVPAEGEWIHAPFSGDIAEGKVWGRGASDTKASVMAFFQAVEELLSEGFVPPTDVYLASSCTEEWGGDGAPKIVAELQRRGIELFLVCDEGGAIITEPIGGIHGNFAMVGVFEKGKADVHEQCDRGKCLRCHFRSRQCAHSHLLRCCLRHLGLIMQSTDHGQSKPRPGCSQTSRQGDDTQQNPHTGQQGKGRTGDDRTLHFRGIHTECLPGAVCPHQKNHTDHRHKSNDPSTDQVHRYTV